MLPRFDTTCTDPLATNCTFSAHVPDARKLPLEGSAAALSNRSRV
jgi:hypothetical protein